MTTSKDIRKVETYVAWLVATANKAEVAASIAGERVGALAIRYTEAQEKADKANQKVATLWEKASKAEAHLADLRKEAEAAEAQEQPQTQTV